MEQGYTDVTVLLDRSGSMASVRQDMEGGFASFVASQKHVPGKCLISMVQFDGTATEVRYTARPIADAGPLDLTPRGNTPLLDAAAFTIRLTGERLAANSEANRPENVVVLIITDGQENASRHTSAAALRAMIEHQQSAYQWQFIYLGANVNAFAEARQMGIPTSLAANYEADSAGIAATYDVIGAKFSRLRGGEHDALAFTPEERKRMKRDKNPA